jgi:hypothetical protein
MTTTRQKLVHAATRYDEKQMKRRGYNPYALGQYLMRIDDICADIEAGASESDAICAGFTGTLRNTLLKACGLDKNDSEPSGWHYVPASKR